MPSRERILRSLQSTPRRKQIAQHLVVPRCAAVVVFSVTQRILLSPVNSVFIANHQLICSMRESGRALELRVEGGCPALILDNVRREPTRAGNVRSRLGW